jgi:hypothetical protein
MFCKAPASMELRKCDLAGEASGVSQRFLA